MRSEWDMPRPANQQTGANPPADGEFAAANDAGPRDGILDPSALVSLLVRKAIPIAVVAGVITAACVAAILAYPFSYKATAIVLADPRDQRVTLQEDVLPAIGADAAVLESMVQIVKSDGFLLATMKDLGLAGADGQIDRTSQIEALGKFRKKLTVERKGATYLVEISYAAESGEEAARIANGVANAFADSQNQSRNLATVNAAKSLAARLVELRAKLNASEEAVAKFKAEKGIVFVDQTNTLQMRQLTELSQQLAVAKNETEEARARYDEVKGGGSISISARQSGEGGQLSFLRQQRAELAQSLEQQQQIYGPRHPRIIQTQQMMRGLDSQIAEERRLLEQQLKATLDVAANKQAELEKQIASLSSGVSLTEAAQVELDALEREAAANRDIYQQFLARNKQTDELALLVEDNVRIVSEAVPPLRSTRPSLSMIGPALALVSLIIATAAIIGLNLGAVTRRVKRSATEAIRARVDRPRRPAQMPPQPATRKRRQTPDRDPLSLLDDWQDEDDGYAANGFKPDRYAQPKRSSASQRSNRDLRRYG